MVIGALPAKEPLSLTGGLIFKVNESVRDISTCDCFLSGPKTRTFSIAFKDGPIMVNCSLQAY